MDSGETGLGKTGLRGEGWGRTEFGDGALGKTESVDWDSIWIPLRIRRDRRLLPIAVGGGCGGGLGVNR